VLGLDNRPQALPHFQLLQDLGGGGAFGFNAAAAGTSYSPDELAKLYKFPTSSNGTKLDGTGQCVGIIELGGGYIPADLDTYFKAIGVKRPAVKSVSVDHGRNRPGSAADAEVMLDIEVVGAVAPGAKIAVYFAPNTSRGFLDAITTAVHDTKNKPSIISISWGAPESPPYWTDQAVQAYNQAFQEAATLGVTICCAAGDNGSGDGATDGKAHVDFPSASPYVLACGGTKLTSAGGSISSEVVWNESPNSATGGGVSEIFALPTWQQGAHVPTSVNPGHKTGRGVPDVAGDADPRTGYKVRYDGSDEVIGGTSAVAPLWAGLLALINQSLGLPVGYINPLLYGAGFSKAFNDITKGNNGGYSAGSGWDACTGLGSPDGEKILVAMGGK
jgi:kumamolisin